MIIGMGIDTVHVPRFAAVLDRRPRMLEKLFTPAESHAASGEQRTVSSLAARFAAKEAVAKALGAPPGLQWHDCQVLSAADGRPELHIDGTVAAAADKAGIAQWHISLTHDGDYAIAQVIAEGTPPGSHSVMYQDRQP